MIQKVSKAAKPKATPKASLKKGKKKSEKDLDTNKLVLSNEVQGCPDENTISKFVDALFKVHEAKQKKNKLFEDEGSKVHVQVNGIKLPKDDRRQLLRVTMPHCVVPDPVDVCLIVKDLEKGLKVDHEPTINHFKELLEDKGVKNITKVMSLRELKVEYKPHEAKLSMSKQYDVVLADDRIIRLLPKFLGKHFYSRKRFPIQVNLRASDLKKEVGKAIRTVTLPLNHHGTTATICVGNSQMKKEDLVENLLHLNSILKTRYPGGWKNVRSLNMKTENSPAVPFYVSTASGNEVGFVDADVPKKIKQQAVTDELSLHPGMKVTVLPTGQVKVKREKDPEWDFKNDPENAEKFEDGSDEEDEDKKEEKPERKRKLDGEAKSLNKKKMKKEDSSSEDEEAEENEKPCIKNGAKLVGNKNQEPVEDDEESEEELEEEEDDHEVAESSSEKADSDDEEAEASDEEVHGSNDEASPDIEEESEEGEDSDDEIEASSDGDEDDSSNSRNSSGNEEYDDLQPLDQKDIILDDDDDEDSGSENDITDLLLPNQASDNDNEDVVEKKPKVTKKTKNMKRKERNNRAKQEAAKTKGRKATPTKSSQKGKYAKTLDRTPMKSGKTGKKGRK